MQTPPPVQKPKRGLLIGLCAGAAVVLAGGAFLALQKQAPPVGVGGSGAMGAASTPTGVSAEPTVSAPSSVGGGPAAPAIASEKARPPIPDLVTSAAAPVATAVRSARPSPPTQKPARSDERGLAKDNPFK